jgi:dipeptidyl aminopeptidase/acylaminoacyl peptidase
MSDRNSLRVAQRLLAAAVCLLASAGCYFHGLTWLPDSSGFVYTDVATYRQVFHYDLAKRERRLVIADTGTRTAWPAVSPDGKRIAVARVDHPEGKPETLQVIVYDLHGRELHRSPTLPWRETGLGKARAWDVTAVFWAPQCDKLVVCDYERSTVTGIYDVATQRLGRLEAFPLLFAGTPIRPDGKGFLVAKTRDRLDLVDWEGGEQGIPVEPDSLRDDQWEMLGLAQFWTSRWQGDIAVVSGVRSRIRVDTARRTVAVEEMAPERPVPGERIVQQYAFPDGGAVIRLREQKAFLRPLRLEVLPLGADRPHVLDAGTGEKVLFIASPDKKWVAVRGLGSGTIRVLNRRGEIVAEAASYEGRSD